MPKKQKPILKLNLGDNGGVYSFASLDELIGWLTEEQEQWQWMAQITHTTNEIQQSWRQLGTELASFIRSAQDIRKREGQEGFPGQLNNLESLINNSYIQNKLIHSSSSKGIFILSLKDEQGDLIAAYALTHFLRFGVIANNPNASTGLFEALLFTKGIKSRTQPEKKSLSLLKDKWNAYLEESEAELSEIHVQQNQRLNEVDKWFENAKEEHLTTTSEGKIETENLINAVHARLSEVEKESRGKLEAIETTFDEKLRLQAPVTYWSRKRKHHKKLKDDLLIKLTISGGIGLIAIIFAGAMILAGEMKPPPLNYLFLVLLMSSILWILRIGVKLYLSHAHLEEDANERVTIAHSFLALLRRGGTDINQADRKVIVEALFRHTPSGLQKEESANPHIVLDLIDKLKR